MRVSAAVVMAVMVVVGATQGALARATTVDPPILVPWNQVGSIRLGESRTAVIRNYGSANFHFLQRWGNNTQGYFVLHGSRLLITFYGARVGEIGFTTTYYRTKDGFGVGSRIPIGACHRTATMSCEHRWNGFVYNEWNKGPACECWVKIGAGPQSLPVTARNYNNPWFFIYTKRGRVSSFYFALKFVD